MTNVYENFSQCLQRMLNEGGISASRAAQLVGFRSRNSIFRILSGETSVEVDARFLNALRKALADSWPEENWRQLEQALDIKRVGLQQHMSNQAFCQGINGNEATGEYLVEMAQSGESQPLGALLREVSREGQVDVVICGCCERALTNCLVSSLAAAALDGRLNVRHYIDVSQHVMVRHLLAVMPLLSKVWYNARLVNEGICPEQMAAIYRVNMMSIYVTAPSGEKICHQLIQCDGERFIHHAGSMGGEMLVKVLDRFRFQLELLKSRDEASEGPQAFVEYTERCAALERDCMILSVKPDVHFNLVPAELLYAAIEAGFAQSGISAGQELQALMLQLKQIHDRRVDNMTRKRRPTHIVYSLPAMERFMRTGVQSDHFFIQRAYTLSERRAIIQFLLSRMQQDPYFNICFMRPELPEIRSEMTLYEGKGVLLMDAYTSYDLHDDHSEAFITLPEFQRSFQAFYLDELLGRLTLSRQESMACMEQLLQIGG